MTVPWEIATLGAETGRTLGEDTGREVRTWPVDVDCGCGRIHPGAPKNVTGCGIKFRVEVREGRDD